MAETSKCNRCGATLPPDSPEGLCPRCLIALNLATQTEVTGESGPGPAKLPPLPAADVARLFPQLEILDCLGRGGMGAVYKARQPRLDRIVALKILSPEKQGNQKFTERFEREARALAKLHHPNIVTVYDFGVVAGVPPAGGPGSETAAPNPDTTLLPYLIMEFVDGVTLRQLLHNRKLSPPEALAIVPKICEALQYAHAQGIVHRDIKPENILMDREGHVKIADFGIAKILGEGERGNLTEAQAIGTPHYMSPEQIEKPQAVDHRADIYSLGVVFYEMLTGELPLGKFQPPSKKVEVDVRLDDIVLRALEKEPERRYQQVSEIKTQVESVAATAKQSRPAGQDEGAVTATGHKSGIVRIVEIFFDITFKSRLAITLLNLSALGFLASLGFLGFLPGMQFCFGFFGFTGFFGLIGAAFLAEFLAGNRSSNVSMALVPLIAIAAIIALVVAAQHFSSAIVRKRYQPDSHSGPVTNVVPASAETWSPTPAPGETPNLQKILESAKSLTDAGSYEDALQRYIWYFNHSRNDPGQGGVRLSFALSDWAELARRYPKAKQALIEIRDADTRRFSETGGYSELFQEISSLNSCLNDDDATVKLLKSIPKNDPTLVQQCFFLVEGLLVQRGDYQTCREYIGGPQPAFDRIRQGWQQMRKFEKRAAAQREDEKQRFQAMAKTNAQFANMVEIPGPTAFADENLVGQTLQLIEILVATGGKSDAQKIQAQALALVNDPRLQTAVDDAEAKISGQTHAGPISNSSVNHAQVISVWPPDGATNLGCSENLRIRFSHPMNPNLFELNWMSGGFLSCDQPRYDSHRDEFSVPVQLLAGVTNKLLIGWAGEGLRDTNGNPVDEFTWQFTTRPFVVRAGAPTPHIVQISPSEGKNLPVLTVFQLTFDQPMSFDYGFPYLRGNDFGPPTLLDYSYDPDAHRLTIPVTLPPDNETKLTIYGFHSADGIEADPVVIRCDIGTNNYSRDQLADISKAAKDPRLKQLLTSMKTARTRYNSGIETVQTIYLDARRNVFSSIRLSQARFKWQGTNRFYEDISEVMNCKAFVLGTDGKTCWLYGNGRNAYLNSSPAASVDIRASVADPFDLTHLSVDSAIAKGKLIYDGEVQLDGHSCYRVECWYVNQTGQDVFSVEASKLEWWIDAQTYLPVQVTQATAHETVKFRFDGLNQLLPDSAFQPPVTPGSSVTAEDWFSKKLAPHETRFLTIKDGSDGGMSGRFGRRGPNGTTSSGLN